MQRRKRRDNRKNQNCANKVINYILLKGQKRTERK
jgi:hypothetical protein